MVKSCVIFFVLLSLQVGNLAQAAHPDLEKSYQKSWCSSHDGTPEVITPSGARVDCMTPEYVVEVEFAGKYCESVGQSILYSRELHRKPGIVLIIEDPFKEQIFLDRLNKILSGTEVTYGTNGERSSIKLWIVHREDLVKK